MWTPQYFVRYARLPLSIEGVALPNDDGSFDIYINSLLPEDRQADRLQHEIRHIQADHFYKDSCPVARIEAEANGATPPAAQSDAVIGERKSPTLCDSAAPADATRAPAEAAAQSAPHRRDVFGDAPAGRIPCFTDIEQFLQYFLSMSAGIEGEK